MRALGVCAMMVAAAAAGCLTGEPSPAPVPEVDAAWARLALESGHDHADPILHGRLTTPNFATLGHNPLVSRTFGTTPRGNLCGDAADTADGRRLAAVETREDIAFTLVDVTDPADPQWLGELVMARTYVYDLAVAPDGRHVVLVTSDTQDSQRSDGVPDIPAAGLTWRSPCTGGAAVPVVAAEDPVPRPKSLLLVSIEDPAEPAIIDQRPLAERGHSVWAGDVDGRTLVVASALACATGVGCPSGLSTFSFYEVAETPAGARLNLFSTFTHPTPVEDADAFALSSGHNDAWVRTHPVTGQTLAYLANWDVGVLLVDVGDPTDPRLVGRWTDHDSDRPGDDTGNVHSAFPLPDTWDGRHYTVVGPELVDRPTDTPTGVVHVLDTTDPAAPFAVAAWTLPHDVVWDERLHWSTHYLTVVERTLFVSMYHGGVWAVDLSGISPDRFQLLPSIGVYLPVERSPAPPPDPFRWTPTLEEVLALDDGTLVTFDSNTGVYTFRFDDLVPVASPEPWPLDPPKAPSAPAG